MKFFPPSRSSLHLYKVHLDYEIQPPSASAFLFAWKNRSAFVFLLLVFFSTLDKHSRLFPSGYAVPYHGLYIRSGLSWSSVKTVPVNIETGVLYAFGPL